MTLVQKGNINAAPFYNNFEMDSQGEYTRTLTQHGYSTDGTSVTYPVGVATAQSTVRDSAGRVVLEESFAAQAGDPFPDGVGGAAGARFSWTYRIRDDGGRELEAYRSDGTRTVTDWDDQSCCGTRTVEDGTGVVRSFVRDSVGRLVESTTYDLPVDQPCAELEDLTTAYAHTWETNPSTGALERVVTMTVQSTCSAVSPLTSVRRYNLAGQLVMERNSEQLSTLYSYGSGGRNVTITHPWGVEFRESYRDGRPKRVSGTAVVEENYTHEVLQNPAQSGQWASVTRVYRGRDAQQNTPRWVETWHDGLGRLVREERPAYPPLDTVVTDFYYDAQGRLQRESTSGAADTRYEYESLGSVVRRGTDLDGSPGLQPGGTDRYVQTEEFYTKETGALWWRENRATEYLRDNDSNDKVVRRNRERLTGYGYAYGNETTTRYRESITEYVRDGVIERSEVTSTTTKTTANARRVVDTTVVPGSTTAEVTTTFGTLQQSTRSASNLTTTYGHDGLGRQRRVTDPRTGDTITVYDPPTGRILSVTNAHGDITLYGHDPVTGRLSSVGRSNGAGGYNYTYYKYTSRGELSKTWGDVPQPSWIEYDGFGSRWKLHTYRTQANWSADVWPTGDVTIWGYHDATGLLTSRTDADGQAVTYTYTPEGKLETRTWARGIETRYVHDPDTGELLQIDYGDDGTFEITFTYDRYRRIATVADLSTGTDHAFDYLLWPDQVTETISGGPLGRNFVITRDMDAQDMRKLAELSVGPSTQDRQGDYHGTYEYQPATGRMEIVTGPGLSDSQGNAHTAQYEYLAGSDLVRHTWFKDDAGTILVRSERAFESHRDVLKYVESRWRAANGTVISMHDYRDPRPGGDPNEAGADPLGRRTRLSYSSGVNAAFMEDYGYNTRNELTAVDHWENGVVDPAYDYVYDPIGNRTTYSVDPSIGDPEVTTYSTNNLNQYYRTDVADPKTAQGYRYDEDGNLLEMYVAADMNCDGVVDMNQDLSCFVAVINQCPPGPDPYSCAPCPCLNGDLDGDGAVTFADINRFVPLVNAVGARQVYAWDAENRLLSVGPPDPPASGAQRVLFRYDYLGRRIWKQVQTYTGGAWQVTTTRKFIWDGWRLLLETDGADTVVRKFTWGLDLAGQSGTINSLDRAGAIGGLLAVWEPTGGGTGGDPINYIFLYDGNGNVGQVVDPLAADAASSVKARYVYDAYGDVVLQAGSYADANPIRFSTKYWDDETGLGYWGYRYYDPRTGRWLSRDPAEEFGDLHLYRAMSNLPTAHYDVLGLFTDDGNGGTSTGVARTIAHYYKKAKEAINRLKNIDCAQVTAAISAAQTAISEYEGILETVTGVDKVHLEGLRLLLQAADLATRVRCRKPEKCGRECKPCEPPVGTIMYEIDTVPPSRPHYPHKGTHTHYFVVLQSPPSAGCVCWRQKFGSLDGAAPLPGTSPIVELAGGGIK